MLLNKAVYGTHAVRAPALGTQNTKRVKGRKHFIIEFVGFFPPGNFFRAFFNELQIGLHFKPYPLSQVLIHPELKSLRQRERNFFVLFIVRKKRAYGYFIPGIHRPRKASHRRVRAKAETVGKFCHGLRKRSTRSRHIGKDRARTNGCQLVFVA